MPGSIPASQFFSGQGTGTPIPPQAPQVPQQPTTPASAPLPQGMTPMGSTQPQQPTQPTSPSFAQSNQPISAQDFWSGNYQVTQTPQTSASAPQAPSIGGFLGNAVTSLGGVIGNVGNAILHPIQTVKNLGNTALGGLEEGNNLLLGNGEGAPQNAQTQDWNNLVSYYAQKYGSPQAFLQSLYKDPAGVALDASVVLGGVGGALGAVGDAGEAAAAADAVDAGDVIAMGGKTAEGASVATPAMTTASKLGETFSKVGEAINPLNVVTKPLGAIANSLIPAVAKGGFSQLTGIQPSDIDRIVNNPDEFSKDSIANYDRSTTASKIDDALQTRIAEKTETGTGYNAFRTDTENQIPVDPDYLRNLITSKTGLAIEGDGTASAPYELKATADSSIRDSSDVNALQKKILNTYEPEFAKGYLTNNQYLNLRGDLSTMAKYGKDIGKSDPLENLSSIMKGQMNTDLRSNIPGLAETDEKFRTQAQDLKELREGILNKDGTMKEGAANKIANATGKGKDAFAARLEKIVPGITDEIKNGVTKEHLAALQGNVVGTYGRTAGIVGAGIAGLQGGPIAAIASAFADQIVTNPDVAVPFLRVIGKGTPLYKAILEKFNVSTPAGIAGAIGRISQATQPRKINIKLR